MVWKIILALIVIAVIAFLGVSAYIAMNLTQQNPSPVTYDRSQIGRGTDVTFRSADNLQLTGWYFPGTNDKAIMFVHGAGDQNRSNEVYGAPEIAKYFLEEGYTILMFDLRGTGQSTPARISFGQNESKDVAAAFNYLKTQDFEPKNIAIISDSLGAIATALASSTISDAGAIVLDSPASEVKSVTSHIMKSEHSVPAFLHPAIYMWAKVLYGVDVNLVRPIDYILPLRQTPILFLHGENDTLIPPYHSEVLLKQVEKGRRVLFPGTKHVETYITHPELYKTTVSEFFTENLQQNP